MTCKCPHCGGVDLPASLIHASFLLGRNNGLEEAAAIATTYSDQWENDNITAVIASAIRQRIEDHQ